MKPVHTGAGREVSLAADVILVSGNSGTSQESNVTETPSQSSHGTPRTVRRFFPDLENGDVVPFCERQLAKLAKLVNECEGQFL